MSGLLSVQRNGDLPPIPKEDLAVLLKGAARAAWTTFVFHAARSRIVDMPGGIAEAGLDPRKGGTGASKGNAEFERQSAGKVHYTRSHPSASSYKRFFETGEGFPGKSVEHTEAAEVLQVSLPSDIVAGEARDKDDKQMAYTVDQQVPPENIRSMKPKNLPNRAAGEQFDWREHVAKGFAASAALVSNMPPDAQKVLERLTTAGYDPRVIMKMLENALAANPADKFLSWDDFYADQKLGVFQGRAGRLDVTALGTPVKEKSL